MMPIILLICAFILVYMCLYYKVNIKTVFILKIITSFCFVAMGFITYFKSEANNSNYPVLIIAGLISGFFGDIALGLRRVKPKRKNEYFILGIILFFSGHIFYVVAFLSYAAYKLYWYFIVGIIITIVIIITMKLIGVKSNKSKYFNYLYVSLLSLIVAITFLNMAHAFTQINIILAIGAILFMISDLLLYFIYFGETSVTKSKVIKMINIVTYYIAQMLFALSIYYL
ncbi:MAG: lysoplasmalogenase [Bacilli bacterium]|nr:lysoplasmalogenase [Bacilli bacterium]MDD4076560.1 lysoplasmalogenase family protein [Bacilli bacterium]MDD4387911.1 lysoplasmalogenase family protein [Bacilli bacterium]